MRRRLTPSLPDLIRQSILLRKMDARVKPAHDYSTRAIFSNRRAFITLLGGAAVAWPLAAHAQQADRVRRIGVLLPLFEDDPFARAEVSAFVAALQQAGWTDGRNARIEIRWAGPTPSDIRRHAAELV